MRTAAALLLLLVAVAASTDPATDSEPTARDNNDDDNEDYLFENRQHTQHTYPASMPCCTESSVEDVEYIIISTMDGRLRALDGNSEGRLVWDVAPTEQPLMRGTLHLAEPMSADGNPFNLVPSLDGSLYMYSHADRMLRPIPANTELLLRSTVRLGDEALAGGKSISMTGIEPVSGSIRYRCESIRCEQEFGSQSATSSTLVARRTTHTMRAFDPLNGTERWHLEVGELELSLLRRGATSKYDGVASSSTRYIFRPPDGVVIAVNNCTGTAYTQWQTDGGGHIVKAWLLRRGQLTEISLFDPANIQTTSDETEEAAESGLNVQETLFYIGTINNSPFIVNSARTQAEMRRLVAPQPAVESSTAPDRQLMAFTAGHRGMYVEAMSLADMLGQHYMDAFVRPGKSTVHPQKRRAIADKATNSRGPGELTVSCPLSDGVDAAFISEQEFRPAGWNGDTNRDADRGWLVLRPSAEMTTVRRISKKHRWLLEKIPPRALQWVERVDSKILTAIGVTAAAALMLPLILLIQNRRKSASSSSPPEARANDASASSQRKGEPNTETDASCSQAAAALRLSATRPTTATASTVERCSTATTESAPFESKFFSDYTPEAVIGRGGFGVVFKAQHNLDKRLYAIKRIYVADTEASIDRVLREVRLMAQLDHPHIIRYHHTWLERPPPDWQRERDDDLLRELRSKRPKQNGKENNAPPDPEEATATETESLAPGLAAGALKLLRYGAVTATAKNSDVTRSESWLSAGNSPILPGNGSGDSPRSQALKSTLMRRSDDSSSSSSSSSDDDNQHHHVNNDGPQIKSRNIAIPSPNDYSESVVFDHDSPPQFSPPARLSADMVLVSEDGRIVTIGASEIANQARVNDDNDDANKEDELPTVDGKFACLYIQMELCRDRTLHSWLSKNRHAEQRPISLMLNWFSQLVSGLKHIHDKNLIHRDIKPQNIFFGSVQQDGATAVLKIGDLGLAIDVASSSSPGTNGDSTASSSATNSRHTRNAGTRSYMSPEQLSGAHYTDRVDIFSLGLVFLEMVRPFGTHMERHAVFGALQSGKRPAVMDQLDGEMGELISWMTAFESERRASSSQLATAPMLQRVNARRDCGL